MNKCLIYCLLVIVTVFGLRRVSRAAETNTANFPLYQTTRPNITDLTIIYCGMSNRPAWTLDELQPYVSYADRTTGKEEWLFDGFLFLEFKDGQGAEFEEGWKQKPAHKEQWQWLLNRFFEPGHAIPALETTIGNTEKRIGKPLRPRQVVITLPEPNHTQTDWGEIAGKQLNFTNPTDRIAACDWYIQAALEKWKQLAPAHLELAGFYWIAESAPDSRKIILPEIGNHIRSNKLSFFWIPYWRSTHSGDWKQLGFDVAYQQPNYFFHPELPLSRLQEACDFARQHSMGMELELDGRLITDPQRFGSRLQPYLNAFETNGIKSSAAIAYYEGGGAFIKISKSEKPEHRQFYDRLARWVLDRQDLADRAVRNSKPASGVNQ
ncbi:DUF4855 domain-containing protein [Pedosphaera parvula]|uniref:DUF4855 domain-containing protein n=1 Tax=Pedosphaera parvula TaxID=1032527 RepID=UPI00068375B2|nr:DUF4855 domain-containing protein [Pedosphaera parvula]